MRQTRGDQPPEECILPTAPREDPQQGHSQFSIICSTGKAAGLMKSWQEDGGAEGRQQSLHCIYTTCLKHEAKPFHWDLADVQHFDHSDCC